MPDPVAIRQVFDLAPEQAIAFLDAKGYRTSVRWSEVWQEEHATAFTVAKVAKLDLLREIHVSLLDAMAQGQPFEAWAKELRPKLEAAGWWGRVQDAELTGTSDTIQVGPRRLKTIYDTNLRTARATALWDRIQSNKAALPFLRYSAVLDRRTRPQHRAWHGIVLPVDHPWWLTHFPPNGWRCRCTVQQMSQAMLDRRGFKVTLEPPTINLVPFRRATGEVVFSPQGIDPGFGYNVGTARMLATAEKIGQSIDQAAAAGLVDAARATLRELVSAKEFDQFVAAPSSRSPLPAAVLSTDDAGLIGAETPVARLSADTLAKQKDRHPEVVLDDYRRLSAIDEAPIAIQQSDRVMVYVTPVGERFYVAVAKATQDGREIYLTSLRIQSAANIRRLVKGGTVVRGKLP